MEKVVENIGRIILFLLQVALVISCIDSVKTYGLTALAVTCLFILLMVLYYLQLQSAWNTSFSKSLMRIRSLDLR